MSAEPVTFSHPDPYDQKVILTDRPATMINPPYNQYEPYTDVVYRLIGYTVSNLEDKSYPRFNVHMTELSLHRTFEEAKAKMLAVIDEDENYLRKYHSFYICEVPLGVTCIFGYEGQQVWSFDGNGCFNAHRSVSSIEDRNGNFEIFWGREADECQFKIGDIVEIPAGLNDFTLGIICKLPEDFQKISRRLPDQKPDKPLRFHIDSTDDLYKVISVEDELADYCDVVQCFPARTFHLDESYVRKLNECLEAYLQFIKENKNTNA